MTVLEDAHELLRWGRTNRAIALLRTVPSPTQEVVECLARALQWVGRTEQALEVANALTGVSPLAEELRLANGLSPQGPLGSHWLRGLEALVKDRPEAARTHFSKGIQDPDEKWWNRSSMALCLAVDGALQGQTEPLDVYLAQVDSGPQLHPGRTKPDRHLLLHLTDRNDELHRVEAEVEGLIARGMKSADADTSIRKICLGAGAGLQNALDALPDACLVKRLWIGPAQRELVSRLR